jgi:hypothetical protein
MEMNNQSLRPKNWDTAAKIVLESMYDISSSPDFSLMLDSAACHQSIADEFEEVVELLFHSGEKAEEDILQEQFFDIAVASLIGYSYETQISVKKAGKHVLQTIIGKQRMYGHGNIARFGVPGIAVRLNDKLERLKNLQKHDGPVLFEPIQDTWLDVCGYSVIALMWLNDWFMLDLAAESKETSGT